MGARQKCSRHTGKLKRRGGLWFTMGFHQHNAGSWSAAAEETMREFARHPKCVTIGKCGLAFLHGNSTRTNTAKTSWGLGRAVTQPQ